MILCCGEALIDMLPRTTDEGDAAFQPFPGGAVFNTAIALGRLGAEAGFFCGLSTDFLGDQLVAALADARADASLSPRVDRPTTLAFVRLVDGHAEYAFYDEGTALRMMTPDELPQLGQDVTALFFGGISLMSEPCGATFEALMLREAATRVTMIDPNIRASFISDEPAYRARLDRLLAVADIVKVSDEDLAWIAGGAGNLSDQAAGLLARGPKILCVTEGAKGVTAFHAGGRTFVKAEPASVVDTVGAGDTFNAGFLAALDRTGVLEKGRLASLGEDVLGSALSLGARAAAITVSRAGANPPWDHEL